MKNHKMGTCVFTVGLLLAQSAFAEMKQLAYKAGGVSYTLTQSTNVTVQLFDSNGEFVTTLFAGEQKEGKYRFEWAGQDPAGRPIKPGNYLLKAGIGKKATRDLGFAKEGFIVFGNPSDMAVDTEGTIYVLDQGVPEVLDGKPTGKTLKPRGLYHFKGDGTPLPDFLPSATHFLGLSGGAWFVISDQNIFHPNGHGIEVLEKTGRRLYSIGGWNPDPRDPNDKTADGLTPEGKRGIYWGGRGGALGTDNRLYIRNRDGLDLKVFNRTLPKGEGWLFTERRYPKLPPLSGLYAGPCLISDGKRKLYSTNVDGTVRRFDDLGNEIALRYQTPRGLGGDVIGMGLSRDMLYVAQRTSVSRIYQLWDNEEALVLVWSFSDESLKGLRTVAAAPDGKALYLLEDGDNFGKNFGDVQGQARLFRYTLGYAQALECKIVIGDKP